MVKMIYKAQLSGKNKKQKHWNQEHLLELDSKLQLVDSISQS